MNWNTEADRRSAPTCIHTAPRRRPPLTGPCGRPAPPSARAGRPRCRNGGARGPDPVRRALLAAALLLLLFGAIVACVPAARAEVLSWFGITAPEEYLATGRTRASRTPPWTR